jgi:hypothetical protein
MKDFEEFFDSRKRIGNDIYFENDFVIHIKDVNQKSILLVPIGESNKIFMLHQIRNAARYLYDEWYTKDFALSAK